MSGCCTHFTTRQCAHLSAFQIGGRRFVSSRKAIPELVVEGGVEGRKKEEEKNLSISPLTEPSEHPTHLGWVDEGGGGCIDVFKKADSLCYCLCLQKGVRGREGREGGREEKKKPAAIAAATAAAVFARRNSQTEKQVFSHIVV